MICLKKLLVLFILFFYAAGISFAFSIDDKLAKEIKQKEAAVAARPNDPATHFDLAMTYAYSNKIVEGLDQLRKVQDLHKNYAPIAIAACQKIADANPADWKARFRLAFAQYANNQRAEAIKNFQVILDKQPKNIWALGYMGLAYGGEGQYDRAIGLFNRALKLDPEVSSIHYALGEAYDRKGDRWKGFAEKAEAVRLKMLGR